MNTITLTQQQWQIVTQALLDVPAPMRHVAPVYQAIVQQLSAPEPEAQPA